MPWAGGGGGGGGGGKVTIQERYLFTKITENGRGKRKQREIGKGGDINEGEEDNALHTRRQYKNNDTTAKQDMTYVSVLITLFLAYQEVLNPIAQRLTRLLLDSTPGYCSRQPRW